MFVMAPETPRHKPADIKAIRDNLGLTQAKAAARVGVSQRLWSAWEDGSRVPSASHLLLLDLFAAGALPEPPADPPV